MSASDDSPWDHPADEPADFVTLLSRLLAADDQRRGAGYPLLTSGGLAYVQDQLQAARGGPGGDGGTIGPPRPRWDGARRLLWFDGRLLRGFARPSAQTVVLDEFQRLGWPAGPLSVPLPPEPGDGPADVRRRVRDTARNLSRGMPAGTLRFRAARGRFWCDWPGGPLDPG
jgi:hypothetical protein